MAKSLDDPNTNERGLLLIGMAWADRFWDKSVGLLRSPGDVADLQHVNKTGAHTLRDVGSARGDGQPHQLVWLRALRQSTDRGSAAATASASPSLAHETPMAPFVGMDLFREKPDEPGSAPYGSEITRWLAADS